MPNIPVVKRKVRPMPRLAVVRDNPDDPFWDVVSLAVRLAGSHPWSALRELPEDELRSAGLVRKDTQNLRDRLRTAVFWADRSLQGRLIGLPGHGHRALFDEALSHRKKMPENWTPMEPDPVEGNAATRILDKDLRATAGSLWTDHTGDVLVLIQPDTRKGPRGHASVWAVSLGKIWEDSTVRRDMESISSERKTRLLNSGLKEPFVASREINAMDTHLQSANLHDAYMLAGFMSTGGRDHSNVWMKAASYSDGLRDGQPNLFAWVRHEYVSA